MRQNKLRVFAAIGMLAIALAAFFGAVPSQQAQAAVPFPGGWQATPDGPEVQVTVVIPDTGGEGDEGTINEDTNFVGSWLMWVILGALLLGVIIALLARPTYTPPPE